MQDPIRKITNIQIVSSGEKKVRITYYGTGFLYMVRILTGTLLEIGAGKRDASMLPVVIAAEDRSLCRIFSSGKRIVFKKSILLNCAYMGESGTKKVRTVGRKI